MKHTSSTSSDNLSSLSTLSTNSLIFLFPTVLPFESSPLSLPLGKASFPPPPSGPNALPLVLEEVNPGCLIIAGVETDGEFARPDEMVGREEGNEVGVEEDWDSCEGICI